MKWFPLALAAMTLGTSPAIAAGASPGLRGGSRRVRPRTQELTERDREKLAKAKAKRERRAAKRLAGVKR